jgi:hypothetical protein
MIDAVIERCAGIDVGKKFILVCALYGSSHEAPRSKCEPTAQPLTLSKLWSDGCLGLVACTW